MCGADLRNLQEIDVPIPLSRLSVITGVSGSGKSTFVEDVLAATLAQGGPIGCRAIEGPGLKPVVVDQNPIVRDCFAAATGLSASHFSFNRPEGACPTCEGIGAVEVSMRYLPSTWIPCADCAGRRFSDEVLSARVDFQGHTLSIADFYDLSVNQALPRLVENGRLAERERQAAVRILEALNDVGLGYLPLGQPSPTLSGGEAQRVKLAKFLGRRSLSKRLLILDEPSTGLHPQDIAGLLIVLDRLVRAGATIVVVEHNTDIIRAADWAIDLGPGAGPAGGRLLYAGPPGGLTGSPESITGRALMEEAVIQPAEGGRQVRSPPSPTITIRDARAHNLKGVDVDLPKAALTVVTGVSGSGKSSLVRDVLEAEAQRRFLESLSLYERQSTREGPEAPVRSVSGLGVTISIGTERGRFNRRATVGTDTEIAHHLAVLLAWIGQRRCLGCGAGMQRVTLVQAQRQGQGQEKVTWRCPACQAAAPLARPRHFSPSSYAAACLTCHGVGTLQMPNPEKLITHPEKPLCGGAMHSPGFFPKGYICKPYNYGYSLVQALGVRHGFDPAATPWNEMTLEAQHAFLFGDQEPLTYTHQRRNWQTHTGTQVKPGF